MTRRSLFGIFAGAAAVPNSARYAVVLIPKKYSATLLPPKVTGSVDSMVTAVNAMIEAMRQNKMVL